MQQCLNNMCFPAQVYVVILTEGAVQDVPSWDLLTSNPNYIIDSRVKYNFFIFNQLTVDVRVSRPTSEPMLTLSY